MAFMGLQIQPLLASFWFKRACLYWLGLFAFGFYGYNVAG